MELMLIIYLTQHVQNMIMSTSNTLKYILKIFHIFKFRILNPVLYYTFRVHLSLD